MSTARIAFHTWQRTAAVLVCTAVVSVVAAACTSSSSGSGNPTTPTSTTAVPSASTTPTASGSPDTAPSSTTAAADPSETSTSSETTRAGGVMQCAERQLRASVNFQNPAGTAHKADHPVIVYFKNTSTSTCTITGYPGAAIVDAQGEQVLQAIRTLRGNALGLAPGDDTIPVVTLRPGKYASAGIEGVSTRRNGTAQAGCQAAAYPRILVTPPNTSTPVPFTVPWPQCFSFTVHPVNIENNPPA